MGKLRCGKYSLALRAAPSVMAELEREKFFRNQGSRVIAESAIRTAYGGLVGGAPADH